eukprot:TRINITY_DN10110_c0_g1_i7.p1 TRINITY_DN10110_c0_g1~~TRINITY_DN10110_c0_g1_i7.p1  ORF type:complete len:630 (-),score=96.32 TRINITY_DN10110_c0_g1_i7:280-1986(-)
MYSSSSKLRNQRVFTTEAGVLKQGQEVWYRILGQNILQGWVVLSPEFSPGPKGVKCSCCNEIVTMSTFERHAGFGRRRAPYDCTYTLDGISLKELALSLPTNDGDDMQQQKPFQVKFAYMPTPRVKRRRLCVGRAQGRQAPPGKVHQIDDRTKLIVDRFKGYLPVLDKVPGGCRICRHEDFSQEFSDKTMIICDQCESEHHVGCLREKGVCDLKELPIGEWFCCEKCEMIRDVLRAKVRQGEFQLGDNKSARIMRGHRDSGSHHNSLGGALELIRESFDPIKDGISGLDLLPKMVMSEVSPDAVWDFTGMCTVILKRGLKIVAAATFRVFGDTLAELPLVAVKLGERGKGYCKDIVELLEGLFRELGVKEMIVPAAAPTLKMWRTKFGFKPVGHERAKKIRSRARYMCFPDCTFVWKRLLQDSNLQTDNEEVFEDENINDILEMPDADLKIAVKELDKRQASEQQALRLDTKKKKLKRKSSTFPFNYLSGNLGANDDDDITISEIDINSQISLQKETDTKQQQNDGEVNSPNKIQRVLEVQVKQVKELPKFLCLSNQSNFRQIEVKQV